MEEHRSGSVEGCFKIAALYEFVDLPDLESLRADLTLQTKQWEILGGLIIALEGINGTIAGKPTDMDSFLTNLQEKGHFHNLELKFSYANEQPFFRMRIQIKSEIITMGQPSVNPSQLKGIDVSPKEWNEIISDPQVVVVDTRNDYEIEIGTFQRANNPNTTKFSEFPEYVNTHLDPRLHRKVAMYCTGNLVIITWNPIVTLYLTGGIRCEKASSYMRSLGFETVYQLKGGILKYLEEMPEEDSLFHGECYVFDHRTAVGHGLKPGQSTLCRGCRHPLLPHHLLSPHFRAGVHCDYCVSSITPEKIEGLEERNRQMEISASTNRKHLGFNKLELRNPR